MAVRFLLVTLVGSDRCLKVKIKKSILITETIYKWEKRLVAINRRQCKKYI